MSHACGRHGSRLLALAGLALALLATGCAPFRPGMPSGPVAGGQPPVSQQGMGAVIAQQGLAQVGKPYRYGGADPASGFDCSGLVSYAHSREGIRVPRTAAAQFAAARKVDADLLQPGDLVFFRLDPRRGTVTHVGIYTGQGRFVHAPQTGRSVGEAALDEPYYRARFAGAGRLYPDRSGEAPRLETPPR